ncbi:unnamed protein product [Laminaria digitata]
MSSNSCPVDVDENSPSVGESEGSVFDFVLDHPPPAERKEFVRRFRRQEQAESEAYSQQTPRSPPATFAAHNSVRSTGIFQRQQYLLPPPSSDPSAQPLYSERWPLSLETMLPSIDSSRGGGAPSGTAVMSGAGPLAPLAPNTASNTEAGGYSSRTDTAAASKSRISWHAGGELDKLLLIQYVFTGTRVAGPSLTPRSSGEGMEKGVWDPFFASGVRRVRGDQARRGQEALCRAHGVFPPRK